MHVATLQRLARWAAILGALIIALPILAIPTKFVVNGYVQFRYSDDLGELGPSGGPFAPTPGVFSVPRAYVNMRATVDEHISAGILLRGVPNPVIEEAYVEYAAMPYIVRAGQYRMPFGYEIPLSSARRLPLERAQVIEQLLKQFTFDKGVFGYYMPGKQFNISAAVTTGRPVDVPTPDPTEQRLQLVGRVGYTITGGEVGVSIFNGKNPTNNQTMDRYGFDLETAMGPFTLITEAIAGKDGDRDSRGGYLTVAYRPEGSKSQPYARYDIFDPNTDLDNNNFSRITLGYNYYLGDNTKLTLEYQTINDDLQPELDGRIGAQVQVLY